MVCLNSASSAPPRLCVNDAPTFPSSISCEVLDKAGKAIGEKTFWNIPNSQLLSNWIDRPRPNDTPCVPLTNAIDPPKAARRDQRGTRWSDGAVAFPRGAQAVRFAERADERDALVGVADEDGGDEAALPRAHFGEARGDRGGEDVRLLFAGVREFS